MSFYLKFRPQKISELDLFSVRETLGKIFGSGKVPHAFLFLGPRGAGKTSAARIVAKTVNCEVNRKHMEAGEALEEPCLKCERCLTIGSGQDVDVIEIDAASNRGIDDIRALRENVGLSPVVSVKKVYVIDEVHMLSTDAFNALLKTIEEPPTHVMFVLCTTEAHKVPQTIVSRCTLINFTKATASELMESLAKVVKGEGLKVSEDALLELASYVDGSFREAHKLLEQLSMLSTKIGIDEVKKIVGVGTMVDPLDFVKTLASGDVAKCLEMVSLIDNGGVLWTNYLKSALEVVRLELRGVYGLGERRTAIKKESLITVAEALLKTVSLVKTSPVEILPVELMIVNLGEPVTQPVRRSVDKVVATRMSIAEPVIKSPEKIVREIAKVQEEVQKIITEPKADRVVNTSLKTEEVANNWEKVLETLEPMNHSIASLLRLQKIMEVSNGELVVEVGYKFHKEQLENEAKRIMIEEALEQVVGSLKLRCVLKEKPVSHNDEEVNELSSAVEDVFGVM
jgi:DNA polymerase III subunit gamma/tau